MHTTNITMRRSGLFAYQPTGEYHCGTDNAPLIQAKYEVELECLPHLDERGFLVDQMTIRDFFRGIGVVTMSCEQLTQWCAKALVDHVRNERPGCPVLRCWVRLSPEPYEASMEYEHRTDEHWNHDGTHDQGVMSRASEIRTVRGSR